MTATAQLTVAVQFFLVSHNRMSQMQRHLRAKLMVRSFTTSSSRNANALTYSRALIRGLSPDFAVKAIRKHTPDAQAIDQAKATTQHVEYSNALREILGAQTVIEIPAEAGCPDSVFVEDTVVVAGGTALITNPGHSKRVAETEGVASALHQLGNIRVSRMLGGREKLDGGDVLFTGREFFVGLSNRTNKYGVEALARAFPGYRVSAVPLGNSALHLKSVMSMLGPNTIVAADHELGRTLAFFIQDNNGVSKALRSAGRALQFVLVPDEKAANVVHVNGTILMQPAAQYPASAHAIQQFADDEGFKVVEVDTSELAKADGALTCCSVLLK